MSQWHSQAVHSPYVSISILEENTLDTLKRYSLALAVSAMTALATPAHAEPVRIVLLSAPLVDVAPGAVLPPFRVRVERATGEPLAGVQLRYGFDLCDPGLGNPCPELFEYGGFNDGASLFLFVTTGSDGTVTVPGFRAGNPLPGNLPFELVVWPHAFRQTTPSGFVISPDDEHDPIGGLLNAATTVRIDGVAAVPALDRAGLLVLVLLLAGLAGWRLRPSTSGTG